MKRLRSPIQGLIFLLVLAAFGGVTAQESSHRIVGIPFAEVDGIELKLDLYLPESVDNPGLVISIHGGAWRRFSRSDHVPEYLTNYGYAIASLDFRQSDQANFPAQIHDIKAGIRFLRHSAAEYGYDASRMAILGTSSGGHLAALVGVTNGHEDLEGTVGEYVSESSDVQAIVSLFGASNLTTILDQSTPHGLRVRVPAIEFLLGGHPDDVPELAQLASPVFHIDPDDPPLLLLHGDQDPQMPINQSHELFGAYQDKGLQAEFEVVYGAGHGGEKFRDNNRRALVAAFLDANLN